MLGQIRDARGATDSPERIGTIRRPLRVNVGIRFDDELNVLMFAEIEPFQRSQHAVFVDSVDGMFHEIHPHHACHTTLSERSLESK